ncbi:nucleotidyltransferase family protein [Oscillatoria acuminata]|uniref:Putative nucleotidyltransferase n=1 Tax=Oscillatoria acuminata PCC 6304 TaxID=56110 RepID=K9TGV1_9CYAN|nr:nucleotidyltransferase family protein [Oscillatoria acuminata]AFY81351.1 putative nucleotidyltransferase [Oscillatoria acuminata PCC 6304]
MVKTKIELPKEKIEAFCHQWKITEFALFGSVLREDFRPDSDIDVLVTFAPDATISLLDLVRMEQELEELFQRDVDLLSKGAIQESHNWIRRQEILGTAEVFYAAG